MYFLLSPGSSLAIKVRQIPSVLRVTLTQSSEDIVQIFCTHNMSEYRVMLWYQQPAGKTEVKLIGYLNYRDVSMEKPYEKRFNNSGDLSMHDEKNLSLTFQTTGAKDNGVYFCVAWYALWLNLSCIYKNLTVFFGVFGFQYDRHLFSRLQLELVINVVVMKRLWKK